MFGFDPLSRNERAEADALHDYLDDLNAGVLAPQDEIDPSLAATVSQVHRTGRQPAAPYGLKSHIWEDLMSTTVAVDPALEGVMATPRRTDLREGLGRNFQPLRTAHRALLRLNLYIPAAVLIVVLLVAGFGAFSLRPTPGGNAPRGGSLPAAVFEGSPTTSVTATADGAVACSQAEPASLKMVYRYINSAVFGSPYIDEASGEVISTPVSMLSVESERSGAWVTYPPPTGTESDEETVDAITDAYVSFVTCIESSVNLNALSLMTPEGIVSLLASGSIDFGTISTLAPVSNDEADVKNPVPAETVSSLTASVESIQTLDDGRVVLRVDTSGEPVAGESYNAYIFKNVDGRWLVDAMYLEGKG